MARILIADDEAIERSALRYFMTSCEPPRDIEVDEAENGREAFSMARTAVYDVIFMDIRMPGMDGLATAEALRAEGIETPIVLVSAFDAFEYARQALRAGVREYLLKPASREEVLSALDRSLASSQRSRNLSRMEEDSRLIIDTAIEKLRKTVEIHMGSGKADPVAFTDFERLASLEGIERAAFTFMLPGKAATDRTMLGLALTLAGGILQEFGPRCEALGADFAMVLVYGKAKLPVLRDAARETASRMLDHAPLKLLCGLSGPASADSALLCERSIEAARLATVAVPVLALQRGAHDKAEFPHGGQDGKTGLRSGSLAARTLEILSARYASDLSLGSVAHSLGVSPFHLSHVLAQELGTGFASLLARVRLNRAKELLRGGTSAKEASYLVGFADQAYFTRVFRRLEGCTPREFLRSRTVSRTDANSGSGTGE
jgi:two-component system response regulator YesN